MGVVNSHELRRFLIVGHGTERTAESGMIQEQLQSADDCHGNDKHQARQDAYSHTGR
jgi:hypothetical protein